MNTLIKDSLSPKLKIILNNHLLDLLLTSPLLRFRSINSRKKQIMVTLNHSSKISVYVNTKRRHHQDLQNLKTIFKKINGNNPNTLLMKNNKKCMLTTEINTVIISERILMTLITNRKIIYWMKMNMNSILMIKDEMRITMIKFNMILDLMINIKALILHIRLLQL